MNPRQTQFVAHYLATLNAAEAARRAGYTGKANVTGAQLLANRSIAEAVKAGFAEQAMPADEVLTRLAAIARSDMRSFVSIDADGEPTLVMDDDTPTHLIKKLTITERTIGTVSAGKTYTIELHDAQTALTTLARHHGLLTDKQEQTGAITIRIVDETSNAEPHD